MPLSPLARFLARPLALLLLAVALLSTGCGSPAAVDVAESEPVAIAMSEYRLQPQDVRLNGAGERTFEITNDGTLVHRFELRSEDLSRRIALGRPLKPGESETLTVRLGSGSYVMRCAQERHNTLGEYGSVKVG
ncbi:hypothetical protein [Conexibacter sp. CPCC 206217]|uniref:hypothetical protein n=1 Tax=Conexibacter sp. CPCC 206217 TaxID=3064574 RepID=UPI00271A442C|nr:hypothetical protein [Conexibacter sp. CPCC 206217]MDO8211938.1 hypothetical protein [Conexibacter sp. CPCC 206217]